MAARDHSELARAWLLDAALFAGGAGAGLTPIADGDIFWHLAAGRELLRRHAPLTRDPFTVSAAGRAWTDVHWLFQLGAELVYRAGGLLGLVLVKCLIVGSAALYVARGVPRSARPLTAAGLIAGLFCARHLLLLRPVIVTLPFLALFFVRLERFRRHGAARALWPLPLAQIAWCNCQGLSALGPALIGAYALGAGAACVPLGRRVFAPESFAFTQPERRARLLALLGVLAATLLASLVTPYGTAAFVLPLELLSRLIPHAHNPFQYVAENVPSFRLEQQSGEFWHLKWCFAVLAGALIASRARCTASHLLVLCGLAGLALLGNRNVLLLYFLGAPLAGLQLTAAWRRLRMKLRRRPALPAARAAYVGALLALLAYTATAAAREPSLSQPTPFRFPTESAALIAAHGGEGRIFAADHQGGYLAWKLYPRFKPYIDTRLILHTPEEFSDYLGLVDNPERFDAFAERQGFAYVVLPVAYPDRYLSLIAYLYQSESWRLVFTDGSEVLFARRDLVRDRGIQLGQSAVTDHILRDLGARYAHDPRLSAAAKLQLATLLIAAREFQQAERMLQPMASDEALALRARALLLRGEVGRAEAIGTQLLRAQPSGVRNLDLMAQVSVRRGRKPQAIDLLRRALAIDPFDAEAASLLSTMEELRHEP